MKGNEGGTTVAQQPNNADDSLLEENITRRRMMQVTGAAAATAIAAGATGTAAASHGPSLDFSSPFVDDPYINGSVTVETTEADMAELEYVADDDTISSLIDDGIVLATTDDETANNPVTLRASNIDADEFAAFPRGTTYDDDNDSDTDEEDVSVLDATHWSTDESNTSGSITVSSPSDGQLKITTSSQGADDTAVASFDLSSVGSEDATITDGMSRRFLQQVVDVDTLPSGVSVDVVLIDSSDNEVSVSFDPSGDASTTAIASDSTGDSQVLQTRVGELENDQSVDLEDIEKLEVRVNDGNPSLTYHGLNVERSSVWEFGEQEFKNADDEIETETLEEPAGDFSITSLSSLPDWVRNSAIHNVAYDVEMRASELPDDQVHVRTTDAPESYDRANILEYHLEFEWPSAYALETVSADNLENEVAAASSRYLSVDVATGVSDIDDEQDDADYWDDVDNRSWTDKSGSMNSVGSTVELLSTVAASDRTEARIEVNLSDDEADGATTSGPAGVGAVGGGGGGLFGGYLTWVLGGVLGIGAVFRKQILGFLGR